MRMWGVTLNEFLPRLKVCLTEQIDPYNYTTRANHANKFPQIRHAPKKQTKGQKKKEQKKKKAVL